MEFETFIQHQNVLYNEISREITRVERLGLEPRPSLITGERGIMIALGYEDSLLDKISQVSSRVNTFTPSVVYDRTNLHTTLISSPVNDISGVDYKDIFIKILRKVNTRNKYEVSVNFDRWLLSRESLILGGQPNEKLFNLVDSIVKSAKYYELDLKYPKMTHISLSRFSEKRSPDQIGELLQYLKELKPIGLKSATRVFVASFDNSVSGVNVNVYESINLNDESRISL